jgi:hypothetical protein
MTPEGGLWSGEFYAGDVLLFAGIDAVSRAIRFGTSPPWYWPVVRGPHWRCISHLAFICDWHSLPLLIESTTLTEARCAIRDVVTQGVQAHFPLPRIARYEGAVWLLRPDPSWRLSHDDRSDLTRFVHHQLGRRYDLEGAVRSASLFPAEYRNQVRFCSDLGASALQRVGLLSISNPKRYTPSGLARTLVANGNFQPPVRLK